MVIFMKFWISIILIVIVIAIWESLGWNRWLLFGLFVVLGAVFDNNSHKVNETNNGNSQKEKGGQCTTGRTQVTETSNGNSQKEAAPKNQQNSDIFEKSYGRKNRHRFER